MLAMPLAGRLRLPHVERETNDMKNNNRSKIGRYKDRPFFYLFPGETKPNRMKTIQVGWKSRWRKKIGADRLFFTVFSPPGMEQPKAATTALLAQVAKVLQVLKAGLGGKRNFFVSFDFFSLNKNLTCFFPDPTLFGSVALSALRPSIF